MELFPPMPLDQWRETKETLHRFCQVVGKPQVWRMMDAASASIDLTKARRLL